MAIHLDRFTPFTPSDEDKALAAESNRRLSRHVRKPHKLTLQVKGQKGPDAEVVLSAGAVQLLGTILTEIGAAIPSQPCRFRQSSQASKPPTFSTSHGRISSSCSIRARFRITRAALIGGSP